MARPAFQNPRTAPPTWHRFVRAPPSTTLCPVRILPDHTAGDVTHPDGLLGTSSASPSAPTVLTRRHAHDPAPSLVVDFGQNTVGILEIDFAGAEPLGVHGGGAPTLPGIRLAFSETMRFLSDKSDFTRSYNGETITPGTDQIAVAAAPYTYINTRGARHGTQVCADGLHGFRYLRVTLDALASDAPHTTSTGVVRIAGMRVQLSAFHGTPATFAGWFESSDAQLTQAWFDGVHTNDLCTDTFRRADTEPRDAWSRSLEGRLVLHDGAKRDRDPYVGDLAVAAPTLYLSRAPEIWAAARNVLADLTAHQRADGWIPPASILHYALPLFDYPLWWVVCVHELVLHAGDLAFAREQLAAVRAVLDEYYPAATSARTGLVQRGHGLGDYAFINRHGPVTYYNALYIRALRAAAQLAGYLGCDEDAARWRERASGVARALASHNMDARVGAFFDGSTKKGEDGGEFIDTHAQDGNSLAVLEGVVVGRQARGVLDFLSTATAREYGHAFFDNNALGSDYGDRGYAFTTYFEMAARFETAGRAVSALELARRLYGYMARHDPGVTMWEAVGPEIVNSFTSMAHGWSTGIVPLMSRYVLGVTLEAPGGTRWTVRPRVGDLQWARGVVPVALGGIAVFWTRGAGEKEGESDAAVFKLLVDAPAETAGSVYLPVLDLELGRLQTDGTIKNSQSEQRCRVLVNGKPGSLVEEVGSDVDNKGAFVRVEIEGGSESILELVMV